MNCHICDTKYRKESFYFKCPSCNHVFTPPPYDPLLYHQSEYRKKIFRSGDIKNSQIDFEAFHQNRRQIVERRLEVIRKYLNKDYRCLDVGAGGGTFASIICQLVKAVECLEVGNDLIPELHRLSFKTYHQDFLAQELESYDIIFAWHVLEHVIRANDFIGKAIKLTNKFFIFEVPINRAIPRKYSGHCHHFCDKSIKKMLSHYNIKFVFLDGVQKPARLAVCEK